MTLIGCSHAVTAKTEIAAIEPIEPYSFRCLVGCPTRREVEAQQQLTSVSLKLPRSGMVSVRTTLRVLALTKICNQPYNLPRLVNSFLPDNILLNCESYSTMPTADPITAPFGTWKSPLESETIYQKSASISDLLVDVKTGKVFHVEASPHFQQSLKAVVTSA